MGVCTLLVRSELQVISTGVRSLWGGNQVRKKHLPDKIKETKIPEVVVSDPKKLSLITRSPHKSDAEDARKLARYLRMGETYPVHYPVPPGSIPMESGR